MADIDDDVARLSPLIDAHPNVHGLYRTAAITSTQLRPLRDPNSPDVETPYR